MNQELFERGATTVVTRRTVVKTGAKLAYAVPLVAASFKLSGMSALAVDELTCGCFTGEQSPKTNNSNDPFSGTKLTCLTDGLCYACKGSDTTAIDGKPKTGTLQVSCDGNTPVCRCETQGTNCTYDGATVLSNAIVQGLTPRTSPENIDPEECGPVINPLSA